VKDSRSFFFGVEALTTSPQTERAYLKQPTVFEYGKHRRGVGKLAKKGKSQRHYHEVGLGFKTPKLAVTGKYIDKKCPWTGNVSIRGRILKGRVVSNKMNKTVVVRRDSLHYVKKYNRYEKRHRNTAAHCSPAFLVKEGDTVTIGECRPLSKTVRFNVLEHFEENTQFLQKNKLFRIF
jgi:small subunit ribosomal protein S11e